MPICSYWPLLTPWKSVFTPLKHLFSLQKWNALGLTIPKWCNTCILDVRKGGYPQGAIWPPAGTHAPIWYPPFRASNIQVLHHFGIVGPRAIHFWRVNGLHWGQKNDLWGIYYWSTLRGGHARGCSKKKNFLWKCPQWVNTQHISTPQLANWPKPNFRTAYSSCWTT